MPKILINILVFFLIINFQSCRTINYSNKPFDKKNVPKKPDYRSLDSWAANPEIKGSVLSRFYNKNHEVDVFYIYPTIFSGSNNSDWNADIYDLKLKEEIENIAIKYQASAWANSANIYSPFYRQVHYRAFFEPYIEQGGRIAYEIAYKDVKTAFEYYLKNHNNGKPIIIAGHSQGSGHGLRILKDFFDNKPLKDRLIAAYLIGANIKANEFKTIKPMYNADQTGGFVTWNSYKKNKKPKKNIDPAYFPWISNNVVVNPITWDKQKKTKLDEHKGLYFYDEKVYAKSLKTKLTNGMLWVSLPKNVPNRFMLSFIRNYHFGDINLFWEDINQNVKNRIKNYSKNQQVKE